MKLIYKYPLKLHVLMPEGAKFMHVAIQRGEPMIWVECDPAMPKITYEFRPMVTGGSPPENSTYLTTLFFDDGNFVSHIYQINK